MLRSAALQKNSFWLLPLVVTNRCSAASPPLCYLSVVMKYRLGSSSGQTRIIHLCSVITTAPSSKGLSSEAVAPIQIVGFISYLGFPGNAIRNYTCFSELWNSIPLITKYVIFRSNNSHRSAPSKNQPSTSWSHTPNNQWNLKRY